MANVTADPTSGVTIGIDMVHYAVMESDKKGEEPKYGELKKLPFAKSMGVTSNDSSQTEYYDNEPIINVITKGTKEVTFTKSEFEEEDLAQLLGAAMIDGTFVEGGDDSPPYVALGFRSKTTKGHRYVWLPKGTMMTPDINAATQESNTTLQNQTMKGTFISRVCDSAVRVQINKMGDADTDAFAEEWFSSAKLEKLWKKNETTTPPDPDPED